MKIKRHRSGGCPLNEKHNLVIKHQNGICQKVKQSQKLTAG